MPNKLTTFLIFLFLLGCSKDETVDLSNSTNIFHSQNRISFVNAEERENSKLENLNDFKVINQ